MLGDFLSALLQLPVLRFFIIFFLGLGKQDVLVVTCRAGLQHHTLLVGGWIPWVAFGAHP